MQLATTAAHAAGPRDKSNWPTVSTLPADLPAPARATRPKLELWGAFSAGSFASDRAGYAQRLTPTWDWNSSNPAIEAARLVGRDPRAALAAAAGFAALTHERPVYDGDRVTQDHTLVGLYRAGTKGQYFVAPLWYTPGTNDVQHFGALGNSLADRSDARFTFRDDRLAAVVGIDGAIVNPLHAASFVD